MAFILKEICIMKFKCLLNFWFLSIYDSLGQPTFGDATTGFHAKWRLRNERRNFIPMTQDYSVLGSASDWSCHVGNLIQPIRSTTQIWVVCIISMEFLCLFLRCHLVGKPVVVLPNVSCFLRLTKFEFKGVQFPSRNATVMIIKGGLLAIARDTSKICSFVTQEQQY